MVWLWHLSGITADNLATQLVGATVVDSPLEAQIIFVDWKTISFDRRPSTRSTKHGLVFLVPWTRTPRGDPEEWCTDTILRWVVTLDQDRPRILDFRWVRECSLDDVNFRDRSHDIE